MGVPTDLESVAQSICAANGFTLQGGVGGGSFKKVFRVTDLRGDIRALKVIRGPASSPRTTREIDALRRCQHRNIARLFDSARHSFDGREYDFTIEEYLNGGTLTQRIGDRFLNSNEALALGRALIDAVGHVAALGLVHRDIKPDNIMFRGEDNAPVLVDFGLVRDLNDSSLTYSWAVPGPGTPYFAAPEQLKNEKQLIDWRTDQFSLGVVLCYVRFGLHPYQHAGEPSLAAPTVERVAARGARNSDTLLDFQKHGLACLDKMTRPWPVERYRKPSDLARAWGATGGA